MEKKKARARVRQRNRDGTRFIKEALKKPGCRDRGGGVAKEREREREFPPSTIELVFSD